MNEIERLNTALRGAIQNKNFITFYRQRVKEENMKIIKILDPLDILIDLITQNDSLVDAASVLVDLEHPTPYLLIDALSLYIKTDSRFEPVKKLIPLCS